MGPRSQIDLASDPDVFLSECRGSGVFERRTKHLGFGLVSNLLQKNLIAMTGDESKTE